MLTHPLSLNLSPRALGEILLLKPYRVYVEDAQETGLGEGPLFFTSKNFSDTS